MSGPPVVLGQRPARADRITTRRRSRRAHSGRGGELAKAIALDQVARCNRMLAELERVRAAILDRRAIWQAEAE